MIRATALLVAASLFTIAAPVHAYDLEPSSWNPSALPVPYVINEASAPSSLGASAARAAVDNGFAAWAAVPCTTFAARNAGTTTATRGTAGDGVNDVLWISGGWPAELGDVSSVIGVTSPVWGGRDGFTIDADMQFNNVGFTWTTTGTGGSVDAQSIATHEEGHFLGLDHSSSSFAVMFASYDSGLKRTLTTDDQAGVCAIYPRAGTMPPATDDPCADGSSSCGSCTPVDGCGWCSASSTCTSGTASGPSTGSCGGGWVWLPSDCSTMSSPRTFGDTCETLSDCATNLCVGDGSGSGVCTISCTTDCDCPVDYACVRTSGPRVCVAGSNTCHTEPVDAGMPIVDSGSGSPDAGGPGDPPMDAGTTEDTDAGSTGDSDGGLPLRMRDSSGCSITNTSGTGGGLAWIAMLGGLAALAWRRRSSRG